MEQEKNCDYKTGTLPACAPLAVSYVPDQSNAGTRYKNDLALIRGTVYPGLDLPLGNVVNNKVFDTPLSRVMALDFAAHDVSLYLDTHPHDTEAFSAYKELLRLSEAAHKDYVKQHGPICQEDLAQCDSYSWLKSPWPWEKSANPEA